jgi:hypothetical protein
LGDSVRRQIELEIRKIHGEPSARGRVRPGKPRVVIPRSTGVPVRLPPQAAEKLLKVRKIAVDVFPGVARNLALLCPGYRIEGK